MKQNNDTWIGKCPEPRCGKKCFTTRKKAKRYLSKQMPEAKMTVYKCQYYPEYFHFGHTPYPVARGFSQRGTYKA